LRENDRQAGGCEDGEQAAREYFGWIVKIRRKSESWSSRFARRGNVAPVDCGPVRRRFEIQLVLGRTPIERVPVPLKSRDELPPILAALQWIFQTPEINEQIFALLESRLLAGKKATGRPGLDLWHILVLGVVRLGLDCDYDRLEDMANHHTLLRQILGLSPIRTPEEKPFHYKTLSENVALVDEQLLGEINAIVVQAGRKMFKKKATPTSFRLRPTVTCWRPMSIFPPT
jgi:hypothetical protein